MIGPCDAEWRCLASRSALDILSRGPLRTRTRRSRSRAPEEVAARGGFPLSSSPRLRSHSLPCAMRSAFRSIAGKKKGPSLNAPSLARLRRAVSQCGLAEEHRAAHLQIGARHRRAFDPGTAGLSPPLNLFFCRRFLSLRGRPAATRHANGHSNKPPTHLSLSFLSHFFAFSPSPPPKQKKRALPSLPQAFVSYERATGRPRGFGFVVFADPEVASRVVAQAHTIDRREVEAKRAVPKEESGGPLVAAAAAMAANGTGAAAAGPAAAAAAAALMLGSTSLQQQRHPQLGAAVVGGGASPPPPPLLRQRQQQLHSPPPSPAPSQQALAASLPSNLDLAAESSGGEALLSRPPPPLPPPQQQQQTNRKLFVGGLPPSCDDASLRAYFERFGPVDEAVVMVDHESKRSRGCVRCPFSSFFCFFFCGRGRVEGKKRIRQKKKTTKQNLTCLPHPPRTCSKKTGSLS